MTDSLVLELAAQLRITREDNPDLFAELEAAVEADKEVNTLETFTFTAKRTTANTTFFERDDRRNCPVRGVYVEDWWMDEHGNPEIITIGVAEGKVTVEVPKTAAKSRAKSTA